eukprot:GHVN01054556.1.p1 GENE.GHVN01054556.1~~GHVN01054556.1.p1  ORF type:complete len:108 (-),score=20.73 GHVN01054556.1:818-1141(-)
MRLLTGLTFRQAIVFCNDEYSGKFLTSYITTLGIAVMHTSGKKELADRVKTLAALKELTARVIVSSDLMSRGVDSKSIDLVINFDLPQVCGCYADVIVDMVVECTVD